MTNVNAEIGRMVLAGGIETNLHDVGAGNPVVLVHGSGPGVTAWANWRTVMPELSRHRRVIAPDMVGFGFTQRRTGFTTASSPGLHIWLGSLMPWNSTVSISWGIRSAVPCLWPLLSDFRIGFAAWC